MADFVTGDHNNAPTDMEQTQAKRKKHLTNLTDDYHRSRFGDYDDTYKEFADTYGLDIDCDICGEEQRAKIHTDTELHPDDAADGLSLHPFTPIGGDKVKLIPKYASIANDEMYGMITLFDDLTMALADQAVIPNNGETLNHPAGVVDLDTYKIIPYKMVAMTEDAYHVICGMVQPSDDVNASGVLASDETWKEIRKVFPLSHFLVWADVDYENRYNPDFDT